MAVRLWEGLEESQKGNSQVIKRWYGTGEEAVGPGSSCGDAEASLPWHDQPQAVPEQGAGEGTARAAGRERFLCM